VGEASNNSDDNFLLKLLKTANSKFVFFVRSSLQTERCFYSLFFPW